MNVSNLHKRDRGAGNGHRQHQSHANGSARSSAAYRRNAQRSVLAWLRAVVAGVGIGRGAGGAADENFAKYGKRSAKLLRDRLIFCALCLAAFVFGASVVMFRHSPPADEPKLRNRKTDALWLNRDGPAGEWGDRGSAYPRYDLKKSEKREKANNNRLSIQRFDRRQFLTSYERATAQAAARQIERKHPQWVHLNTWAASAAFRGFPHAKQTHGAITKSVDPDYGTITYKTIRSSAPFERKIADESASSVEPSTIKPTQNLKTRNKNRKSEDQYPNYNRKGEKIMDQNVESDYLEDELTIFYDDDRVHIEPKANDGKTYEPRACQEQSWARDYYPTCNAFHQMDLGRPYDDPDKLLKPRPDNELNMNYIDHGYYRDVWITEDNPWLWPDQYRQEKLVPARTYGVLHEARTSKLVAKAYRSSALKTLQMKHNYDEDSFEEVQLEAVIMERMTYSPRVMNIYGHCGFAVMVEVIPIEFEEVAVFGEGYATNDEIQKRNKDGPRPYNNFTSVEKLNFALEMAESLADLHGFEDGVIVHDDVQMCQWLRRPDGHLVLGDFNRATIMQYDLQRNEYCKFNNGKGFGNYRAPEEFAAKNLDEKIDVSSLNFGGPLRAGRANTCIFLDVFVWQQHLRYANRTLGLCKFHSFALQAQIPPHAPL